MHSGVASGVVHDVKIEVPSKRKKSCAQAQVALFKPRKGCGIMYISAVLLSRRINWPIQFAQVAFLLRPSNVFAPHLLAEYGLELGKG